VEAAAQQSAAAPIAPNDDDDGEGEQEEEEEEEEAIIGPPFPGTSDGDDRGVFTPCPLLRFSLCLSFAAPPMVVSGMKYT
jgi:hypothetical protein